MRAKPTHGHAHYQVIADGIGLTGWQFTFCEYSATSVRPSRICVPICLLTGFPGAVNTVLLTTSPIVKSVWRRVVALSAPVDVSLISIAETVAEEEVLYS